MSGSSVIDAIRTRGLLFFGTTVGVVVLDLATKHYAANSLPRQPGQVSLIPNLFSLIYAENRGAAFGILRGLPESIRVPFFMVVPIVAVAMLLYMAWKADPRHKFFIANLGFVLGGALGNAIDRLRQGYVVDFLDVYWAYWPCNCFGTGCLSGGSCHWPTFNVADIGITVGIIALVFFMPAEKT